MYDLLVKPEMPPIRQSDIMALLVRALTHAKQYNEAARVLKELAIREPGWSSMGILEKALIQKIANECNLDFNTMWKPSMKQFHGHNHDEDSDEGEEIEEKIR